MDATLATILGIVGAFMTLLSVSIAVFTFYFNRKKETSEDSEFRGSLKSDIQHIKTGVDDLKRDNQNMREDIRDLDHRVTLVEASAKSAHHRLDTQERRKEPQNG